MGLITYMRTDSTQVATSAVTEARDYIAGRYGKEYRPEKPRVFSRRSKAAQEAHEAIRPTSIRRDPASLKPFLSSEQLRLYTLVWERMLASQMADAVSEATSVDIDAACQGTGNVYNFRATGSVLRYIASALRSSWPGGKPAKPKRISSPARNRAMTPSENSTYTRPESSMPKFARFRSVYVE